ncbi:hypothetical protein RBH29_16620 [Herbivorax sp. ANBcel31]|uniref:hypothetical protein n=1 Tax=Herbivorax sp. ANBcel31 TaxID=3069754 RepID=UPI0027B7B7AE|nr:hypothetical protein [Herbivorax sp. ANBcel31]MDQ2088053.1 hypothetical protein [Herbivorax sp. ANBcel31]
MINIKSHISDYIIERHAKYIVHESGIVKNLKILKGNLEKELSKEYLQQLHRILDIEDDSELIDNLTVFIDMLINEVAELKAITDNIYSIEKKDISNIFIAVPSQLNRKIAEFKGKYKLAMDVIEHDVSYNSNSKTYSKLIFESLGYNKFSLKGNDIIGYRAFLKQIKSQTSMFYKQIKAKTSRYEGDKVYNENRLRRIKERVCDEIEKYSITDDIKMLNDSLILEIEKVGENGIGKTILEICKIIQNAFDNCIQSYETTDFIMHLDNMGKTNIFPKWSAYHLVMLMGVKSCPYCNRQYITPVYSEKNGSVRADLDHFFAKSIYPYLSISLYNLIPCCKFCNSSLKLDSHFSYETHLHPYEYGFENYLRFRYKPKKYTLSGNKNDEFKIILEPDKDNDLKKIGLRAKNSAECFKLESLYNYHRDEVKNLIKKKLIYNKEYCRELKERLEAIFKKEISKQELLEFVVDNVTNTDRLHERTLSKLYKDIVEQLEFFKDVKTDEYLSDSDYKELQRLIR